MKPIIALAAAVSLTGCLAVETAAVDTGRAAAKAVVGPIVADTVPGAAGVVLTDCIIDNASGAEIVTIAESAVVGTTQATTNLVMTIARRPETQRCAASSYLGIPL